MRARTFATRTRYHIGSTGMIIHATSVAATSMSVHEDRHDHLRDIGGGDEREHVHESGITTMTMVVTTMLRTTAARVEHND